MTLARVFFKPISFQYYPKKASFSKAKPSLFNKIYKNTMKNIILLTILLLIFLFSNTYSQFVDFSESVLPILKVNTNGNYIPNEPQNFS